MKKQKKIYPYEKLSQHSLFADEEKTILSKKIDPVYKRIMKKYK
jgi:hypothetical protein